jgi:hypothetical protein
VVVVRADDTRAAEAERILDRHDPVDMSRRTTEWRDDGWTAEPSLRDEVRGVNDPTLRRPGDVA